MKGILIDPSTKSCREVEYDESNMDNLKSLLEGECIDARKLRNSETILFCTDPKPDASRGFMLPLPGGMGRIECCGPALVVGFCAGRSVDTAMTPIHVERGIWWFEVCHAVS